MFYIAHRGNIDKKNPETENSIEAINLCLSLNLDVEIDVWYFDEHFYLGHDRPITKVNNDFLENHHLWCHAKNDQALFQMMQNKKIHCFWHSTDDYTITSQGFIWAYPGKNLDKNTVCVLPELGNYSTQQLNSCMGICSDQIIRYINAKNN